MNDGNLLASIIGALVGGFLATLGGILSATYQRHRTALDGLIEEVTRAIHEEDLGGEFQTKTAQRFRNALLKARPAISERRFIECLDLLKEYQSHNPEGFNPDSFEYTVFCHLEKIEPKAYAIAFGQRFISHAEGSFFELEHKII